MLLKKMNVWTPRRSIVFMSWSAEEYGTIGSAEWVEVKIKLTSLFLNFGNLVL